MHFIFHIYALLECSYGIERKLTNKVLCFYLKYKVEKHLAGLWRKKYDFGLAIGLFYKIIRVHGILRSAINNKIGHFYSQI